MQARRCSIRGYVSDSSLLCYGLCVWGSEQRLRGIWQVRRLKVK